MFGKTVLFAVLLSSVVVCEARSKRPTTTIRHRTASNSPSVRHGRRGRSYGGSGFGSGIQSSLVSNVHFPAPVRHSAIHSPGFDSFEAGNQFSFGFQSTDDSDEFHGVSSVVPALSSGIGLGHAKYGPCSKGLQRSIHGECISPIVSQSLYVYKAPNLKVPHIPVNYKHRPKVHYNYVFIKSPSYEGGYPQPLVVPPPQQKTLVYLLNKNPELQQQNVIEVPTEQSPPEVYFVAYNDGDNPRLPGGIDLRTALTQASSAPSNLPTDDSHEFAASPIGPSYLEPKGASSEFRHFPPSGVAPLPIESHEPLPVAAPVEAPVPPSGGEVAFSADTGPDAGKDEAINNFINDFSTQIKGGIKGGFRQELATALADDNIEEIVVDHGLQDVQLPFLKAAQPATAGTGPFAPTLDFAGLGNIKVTGSQSVPRVAAVSNVKGRFGRQSKNDAEKPSQRKQRGITIVEGHKTVLRNI